MKKAWHIIKAILLWLVVALAVCMMGFTIVSVNTFDRMDRSLFGYKAFIVLSDSMSATDFNAGDLILVKKSIRHPCKWGISSPISPPTVKITVRSSPIKFVS